MKSNSGITAEILGGSTVRALLRAVAPELTDELAKAAHRGIFKLVRHIKDQKLNGQVLKVRSGRLRRSINGRVETSGANVVGVYGTNVVYARPHEFGFRGRVTVREHTRNGHPVRSHTRNVDLPERSFLRSSFAELRDEISDDIAGSAGRTVRRLLGNR